LRLPLPTLEQRNTALHTYPPFLLHPFLLHPAVTNLFSALSVAEDKLGTPLKNSQKIEPKICVRLSMHSSCCLLLLTLLHRD
jgi:hypothetical protein